MSANDTDKNRVEIVSDSLAARWLAARSDHINHPLAAILRQSRPSSVFVANELLVDAADSATLSQLVEEYDAEVIHAAPVPPQPEGMDPHRIGSVEGMPDVVKVRLPAERLTLDGLDEAAGREPGGVLRLTSRAGAGTLALARRLIRDRRAVMPNLVGQPAALPSRTATEGNWGGQNNPYAWPEFNGPSRIAQAWQLVQAYEQAGSLRTPVFLGIIDDGFALDMNGQPMVINGQPLDLGTFIQWNLINEGSKAGGPGGSAIGSQWHGNGVLSTAAAPLFNNRGSAGAGGVPTSAGTQIVVPVLFKTSIDAWETIRALRLCVAWGIDVVNMSWGMSYDSAFDYHTDSDFPESVWERTFRFAAFQGVVMIAAAGNSNLDLPEEVVLPATRTPGVITVGATNNTPDNSPRPSSNHGSSVGIWAPGTNIHVMPNPNSNGQGVFFNGTSAAAPLVAGVAALMLAVNPSLSGEAILRILRDTAHKNSPDPKVTHAMNAQAALLRVMGDRLPNAIFEEPNNTSQSASPLIEISSNVFGPGGATLISDPADVDWFSFRNDNYAMLDVILDFLPELSNVTISMVPDDPDSRALADVQRSLNNGRIRLHVDLLAPGSYRLMVRGDGPNIYLLRVRLDPRPLAPDMFEDNNTLQTAAWFRMKPPAVVDGISLEFSIFPRYSPGHYEANLHLAEDVDYYHIEGINSLALIKTLFKITNSDSPLDIALLGPGEVELEPPQHGQRSYNLRLRGPECWVRVSGPTANRYHFQLTTVLDKDVDPGPLIEEDFTPLEFDLPYPADGLIGYEKFYRLEVTPELIEIGKLRMEGDAGLVLDLIDETGAPVANGRPTAPEEQGLLEIDMTGVRPGSYMVRVGRDVDPAARFDDGLHKKLAQFQIRPGW